MVYVKFHSLLWFNGEKSLLVADLYSGDVEGEDELKAEFMCPFCADEFDIVGLCCHIDVNHPVEAKNGVMFIL